MKRPLALLALIAAIAVLATTVAAPAAAGEPAPSESDRTESSRAETGPDKQERKDQSASDRDARSARWPGRHCRFQAEAHWPHHSGNDASGHGNWTNTSSPKSRCPDRAYVTVHLQAYGCLHVYPYTCHWRTQLTKTKHARSEDQVPVHVPCERRVPGAWRTYTVVRVPIDGWFDKRATRASEEKQLNCRPRDLR